MPRMVLFVLSLAASVGVCANAYAAHWSVCNRTHEDLDVAIAFMDNQDTFMSEGWHPLNSCGPCVVVLNFDRTSHENVWMFAKNGNVPRFSSAHNHFCVFDGAFRHPHVKGAPCPA